MDEGMEIMKMIKMAGNGRFMMDLWDWEVVTEKEEIEKKRFCMMEGASSVTDKFLVLFFWPAFMFCHETTSFKVAILFG